MSSSVSEAAVLDALKSVRDPDLHRDIVALKFVKNLRIDDGRVAFTIELTTPACPVKDQMRDQAVAAVRALPGVTDVDVRMTANAINQPRNRIDRASSQAIERLPKTMTDCQA